MRRILFSAELRRQVHKHSPQSTDTLPDRISLPLPGNITPITLGRNSQNMVQLHSPLVPFILSHQHAEIKIDPEGVHAVTDKNTTNGTYLNGNIIPPGPCPLAHGDVISFGGPANCDLTGNCFRYQYYAHDDMT
jgi:hypothetical protein